MYDPIADFYSKPQLGSGIAIYQGNRRQAGGGTFSSIARFAVPILRKIKEKILGIAPAVGAKALEVVKNSIDDVRRNNKTSFVEALRDNARETLRQQGLLPQDGSGINRARRRKRRASLVGRNARLQLKSEGLLTVTYLQQQQNDWMCKVRAQYF